MAIAVLTAEELSVFDFLKGYRMDLHHSAEIAQTLADLRPVLGPAVVIGGMAVIHYGYHRYTKDVDILYPHSDGLILQRLKKDFKIVLKAKNGWHHLEHRKTKVRLELIPEGGLTTYGFIPGPKTVGGENGFISLYGLVWLKLVSGRSQDIADMVQLAKVGVGMERMHAVKDRLPSELKPRYEEVLAQAQKELDYDPHHNPDHDIPPDSVKEAPRRYGKKRKAKVAAKRQPKAAAR